MTKQTITRAWITGLVLLGGGAIVCVASVAAILTYAGVFTTTAAGVEFVPRLDTLFWGLVTLCAIGCVAAMAGLIAHLVAWIGALVNTNKLADRTWFAILLVTGLLALTCVLAPAGFIAMAAYVVSGPDGIPAEQRQFPAAAARRATVPQAT